MCLIIYSPEGRATTRRVFEHAAADNADGIGFMYGGLVARFYGPRCTALAWRFYRQHIAHWSLPYGIHFRFGTHGSYGLHNVHPFEIPDSGGLYAAHNGVLHGFDSVGQESDTAIFVREVLVGAPALKHDGYWQAVEQYIGRGNKLLLMDRDGNYRIANEEQGDWIDGIWYSQTYSLPASMSGRAYRWTNYAQPVTVTLESEG